MRLPPLPLFALSLLYLLLAIVALIRATNSGSLDLFSLGVIPVLLGIICRSHWAIWALRGYLAIQTLGLAALSITAILASHISPDDARLYAAGREIPLWGVALLLLMLLAFQWRVAFLQSTRRYLSAPA